MIAVTVGLILSLGVNIGLAIAAFRFYRRAEEAADTIADLQSALGGRAKPSDWDVL